MKEVIEKLLADYRTGHSYFQMDHFIVGAQGNPWAQYKQALREVASRWESLESMRLDLEVLEAVPPPKRVFAIGRRWRVPARVKRIKWEKEVARLRASIASTERELTRFVELAVDLKKQIGELNEDDRARLEAESWADKARRMAQIDFLVAGAISRQTVEFIEHFPRHLRRRLLIEVAEPVNLLGTVDHGPDHQAKK
jgi:hypothetical protein